MIERALATLLCLMGAVAITLGIASATAWRADDVLVASAAAARGTTMVVTDPGVLDMAADTVTVSADADSRVVIALGRTEDVDAWVDGDAHTRVTGLAEWHVLATNGVEAEPTPTPTATPAPTDGPAATADGAGDAADGTAATGPGVGDAAETPAPDPSGSDLWVAQVSADRHVELEWSAREGRWSVLVAAVGEDAGPPSVSLAWPQTVTTPWLWPAVVVGGLMLMGGLAWWARILLAGRRRTRGSAGRPPAAVAPPVPEVVGAAASASVSGAPLTRRQLREMEEQQRARVGRSSRAGLTERFPALVPRARRDSGPTGDPAAPKPAPHGATGPSEPAQERDRRFGLLPRRRSGETVTPSGETVTPPIVAAPAVESPPAPPVAPAATQWTPAASADAWRRAWGLPPASDQPGNAPEVGLPGPEDHRPPPAAGDQPGEPPRRRRRDNR